MSPKLSIAFFTVNERASCTTAMRFPPPCPENEELDEKEAAAAETEEAETEEAEEGTEEEEVEEEG